MFQQHDHRGRIGRYRPRQTRDIFMREETHQVFLDRVKQRQFLIVQVMHLQHRDSTVAILPHKREINHSYKPLLLDGVQFWQNLSCECVTLTSDDNEFKRAYRHICAPLLFACDATSRNRSATSFLSLESI